MGKFIDDEDVRRPQEFPRLSPRYPIPPLKATWFPPSRRKLSRAVGPVEVRLVDISIAGALLEGPFNDRLVEGSRLRIEFGTADGIAEIRNARPSEHKGMSYYGVSYFRMSDEMRDLVHGVVGKIRDDNNLSTVWERRNF